VKIALEVELNDDSMRSPDDVRKAVTEALDRPGRYEPMEVGDRGTILDQHGKPVGKWKVQK
jgi:hypothetical protein